MRKLLSFTTALVSFMAFSSGDVFAADAKSGHSGSESTQSSSAMTMEKEPSSSSKRSAHQQHSGSKSATQHTGQHTGANANKKKQPATGTQHVTSEKKSRSQQGDDGRPKVYLAGVLDTFFHYTSQEDGYKLGHAFYNIGRKDAAKRTINVDPGPLPNSTVNPPILPSKTAPIVWSATQPTPANFGDYSHSWGADANGSLQFKIQGQNMNTGILYGAIADVSLNGVGTIVGGPSPFHASGTYLFASSSYGTISMGYQEGPETSMRIDASNISVGDMGLGSEWYKYANIEGRDGTNPFLLTSGMYTEGFLAGTNMTGQFTDRLNVLSGFDHVDSAMPFRFSYQSPLFAGVKVGVSYAPHYDAKGFTNMYNNGYSQVGFNIPIQYGNADIGIGSSIAPNYKNIISGGISYQYAVSDINFTVAAVGEFGSAIKHDDDIVNGRLYELFVEGRDLRAFGIGAKVVYAGIEVAGSFGSLGKSGTIDSIYRFEPKQAANPVVNDAEMTLATCDSTTTGSSSTIPFCKYGHTTDASTNYFSIGAGYRYADAYVSAMYFRSKAYEKNELRHFAVGGQYNLAYGRTVFAPYVSWNYFWTEQPDALPTTYDATVTPQPYGVKASNGFQVHGDNNKGSVLLAGVRFLFS